MRPSASIERQLVETYKRLADATGHRPYRAGHFPGVDEEARAWARDWWQQEEDDRFFTGCPDYTLRPAMAALIEAARECCAASSRAQVRLLVLHALKELDS